MLKFLLEVIAVLAILFGGYVGIRFLFIRAKEEGTDLKGAVKSVADGTANSLNKATKKTDKSDVDTPADDD